MSQTKVKSGLLNFPDQTDFVKLPSGTTAQRPSSPEKGYSRYNTTDNKLEYWNGTEWQQLPGIVPPTIESVSYPGDDLAADPAGGQTITLTGTNFLVGASVEIDGTLASVVTVVSEAEITFTAPAKAAGDYDILLTNGDSTTATFVDGITYNGLPSWTTPAGNLGSFPAGSTIPTITLVATEPDSGVVSYSVTTGALPTGLTLTGADIDGTVPTPAGETTYNFSVTASDDENQESTERAFNIFVYIQVTNIVDDHDPFNGSGLALYKLDGNATDESGVYNGTATSVSYGSGVFGQAGIFNGSSSKIELPTNGFSFSSFTLSGWLNVNANTQENTLFEIQDSNSYPDHTTIVLSAGNDVDGNSSRFLFRNYLSNQFEYRGLGDATIEGWKHLVLTYDGTIATAYENGQLVYSESFSLTNPITAITGVRLGLSSGSRYLNGSMDQVRVFNTALTPLEVEALYKERIVVCGGQADTLDILGDGSCIATYQLDGNANDLSGNYSGTPTNVSYGVGEFNLAGVFNGSSSKITTVTSQLPIPASGAFTVSFWAKVDSSLTQYNTCMMSFGDFWLKSEYVTGGFGLGDPNTGYETTSSMGYGWNHCVLTVDASNNINLYLNGANEFTGNKSISRTNGGNFAIGVARLSNPVYYFNGQLDQVRIFNKALSAGEVTTLYNEAACDALACGGGTTNTLDILSDGSCVAAYPLDGSPLDLSGNYNGVQTDVTYPVGKFDLGGSFGIGGRIETSLHFDGTTAQGASLSAWFKGSADNSFYIVQAKTLNSPGTFLGYIVVGNSTGDYTDESVMVVSRGSSTLAFAVREGHNAYLDNQWHHIVVTSTSTSKNIYIDGQNKAVVLKDGSASTNLEYKDLMIHSDSAFGGSGEIDQVRIFNKALSAGEVTTLYNETACN